MSATNVLDDALSSVAFAAETLAVSPTMVYRWIEQGRIEHVRAVAGQLYLIHEPDDPPHTDDLITVAQAAALLGLTTTAVYARIRLGRLVVEHLEGRMLIRLDQVTMHRRGPLRPH